MAEYEVAWQVFGTKTVSAESEDAARDEVNAWLEEDHDLTSNVVDGWDFTITGVR